MGMRASLTTGIDSIFSCRILHISHKKPVKLKKKKYIGINYIQQKLNHMYNTKKGKEKEEILPKKLWDL